MRRNRNRTGKFYESAGNFLELVAAWSLKIKQNTMTFVGVDDLL
jgi:hypothetical protein